MKESFQFQSAQRHRKEFKTTFRVREGDETRIIAMQGKTFYNSGAPLMLGVLSDATPASQSAAAGGRSGACAEKINPSRKLNAGIFGYSAGQPIQLLMNLNTNSSHSLFFF